MTFANIETSYTPYNHTYTNNNQYNTTGFSNHIIPIYTTPYLVPANSYGVPLPIDNTLRSYTSYEFAVMLQHKKRSKQILKQINQWKKELMDEHERSREELEQIKMYRLTILNNIKPSPNIKFDLVPVYGVVQPIVSNMQFGNIRHKPCGPSDNDPKDSENSIHDIKLSELETPAEILLNMKRNKQSKLEFPVPETKQPLTFQNIYPPFLLKNHKIMPVNDLPFITSVEDIDEMDTDEIKIYLNTYNRSVQTDNLHTLKGELAAVLGMNLDSSYEFRKES